MTLSGAGKLDIVDRIVIGRRPRALSGFVAVPLYMAWHSPDTVLFAHRDDRRCGDAGLIGRHRKTKRSPVLFGGE